MIVADIPLLLLPGLSGDPRVFAKQVSAFPNANVIEWLPPERSECLASYAQQIAEKYSSGQPCVVAGVSFGGIVALEVVKHLPAKACVLIASARRVRNLPLSLRVLRPVARLIPTAALSGLIRRGSVSAAATLPRVRARTRRLAPDAMAFRQWAFQELLRWQAPEDLTCPLYQVHGEFDTTFPLDRETTTDVVVGGGHLISVTHADEVNAVLRRAIQKARTGTR